MNKLLLLTKASSTNWDFPYLWATAKTYYEEQGQHPDRWEWYDPMLVSDDWESDLDRAIALNPTIIGFSLYTWNEGTFNLMASQIKEKLPNCIVVFGGPQQDVKYNKEYFRQKPYVDLVVPGDAYGEIIFKELLDKVSESPDSTLDPTGIPYCYYPDNERNVVYQDSPIDKRNFEWPSNPFRAQQEYFDRHLADHEARWIMIETSRGCPYRCSFCDWGGGTYTKTVKKPFGTVLDEIRWIGENKLMGLYIADANFGLFDIDIEYAKKIVEANKEYGFPKVVTIQPTKTKIKNLETIFEIFAEAKLLPQFKIAVEDLNEHVLKNIDRVDFPFEEKMDMLDRLRQKFDLPVFVEGIFGLPGSSKDTMQKDIERTLGRGVEFPLNHPWVLLPETPAYAPEYREKFKLVTVKNKNGIGVSTIPIKLKPGHTGTPGVTTTSDTGMDLTAEYVVGTYSYTPKDYVEMTAIQIFVSTLHNGNILNLVGRYMRQFHNVAWGDFYISIKKFLESHQTLGPKFIKVEQVIQDWVDGKADGVWIDWEDDFPYEMQPYNYLALIALTNPKDFFHSIGNHLAEKFNDQKIVDLCKYAMFNVFHIDYQIGKKESFNYNWHGWANGQPLGDQPTQYQTTDQYIDVGQERLPVDWQEKRGTPDYLTHFFYRVCYTHHGKKDVKHIEPI